MYRFPFRRALAGRDIEAVIQCRSELTRLKRELRPDVIQVNFSGPSGYFLLATAASDDPPVVMAVRHPVDELASSDDALVNRLLRAATWVTGNSSATLEAARRAVPEIDSRSS